MKNIFQINDVEFSEDTLPIIAGPCVIESRDHILHMAEKIMEITDKYNLPFIFKSSFDKGNRSSHSSFRGPGMDKGLRILEDVKKTFNIPITTDIHNANQADTVAEIIDIIQIPAFLCRQSDIINAAVKTSKIINIKKGQFMAPWDAKNIVEKVAEQGGEKLLLTERGSSFGYNNLVSDMTSIPIMQEFGVPIIFDATHSIQRPGGLGKTTGGAREFIPTLAKAAVAAGCNGVFMEVHDNPNNAKSDAASQWPLDKLDHLLKSIKRIKQAII
ncbi:MAG: 3-deoxy-8-phosphooctulonate synthase [Candidatus Marinimicrobia bacterium]|nr:3-deoxy-8-phosphooctulonate synthase [Candidatus Neomarinimicrobiota bacterium]